MVTAEDVPRVVADAARLVRAGNVVVFGSGALAWWLPDAPNSRDVDVWIEPAERGDVVTAVMGELSWYHNKHNAYVEVWSPETFAAPSDWPSRARHITLLEAPDVVVTVPHPHDVLIAKLERWSPHDEEHGGRILKAFPLSVSALDRMAALTPYRRGLVADRLRVSAFETHLSRLRTTLPADVA